MSRKFNVKMPKTYATPENAVKAVEKVPYLAQFDYVVAVDSEGRYFPCFVGESAINAAHLGFAVISRN